jgi:hypothetical protein
MENLTNDQLLWRLDEIRLAWRTNGIESVDLDEYASLRTEEMYRGLLPRMEPLTDNQRQIVMHDGSNPAYRLSPLGRHVYTGPRSTDPQDLPLPYMSREEVRALPEYGILQRRLEATWADPLT